MHAVVCGMSAQRGRLLRLARHIPILPMRICCAHCSFLIINIDTHLCCGTIRCDSLADRSSPATRSCPIPRHLRDLASAAKESASFFSARWTILSKRKLATGALNAASSLSSPIYRNLLPLYGTSTSGTTSASASASARRPIHPRW